MHIALRSQHLLFVAALAVACGVPARKRVDGDLVARVTFEGLTQGQGEQMRAVMGQKQSAFLARAPVVNRFAPAVRLDPSALDADTERVETWLAHEGWLDAEVLGWKVLTLRQRSLRRDGSTRRAGVVKVVGTIEPGPRSVVRGVQVAWADDQADRFWRSNQSSTLKRTGYVIPEAPFSLALAEYTADQLRARILDHGHAHGKVTLGVDAYPEEEKVDVTFFAETGPPTTVGDIRISGASRVREEDIRRVLGLEPGAATRLVDLERAQQRLVSLGTFAVVRVTPDLSDPERAEVPIDVTLTESAFGTFRSGFGLVYNGTTVTPRLSWTAKHVNIDGRLARLEAGANVGAGVPIVGGLEAARLLGGFDVGITRPRVIGDAIDTNARLSFQRDLLAGQLLVARAGLTAGFAFRFGDSVTLSTGPGLEFVRLGSGSPFDKGGTLSEDDALLAAATFGSNPRNPFVLTTWQARLVIDWRDGAGNQDPSLDPRGGYYYVASLRQAFPLVGEQSGFAFTDVYGEARFYRSFLSRDRRTVPTTLALRLKGKWVPTFGSEGLRDAVPYSERAFMGGALDMRGFRINQVGAYDCVCLERTEEVVSGPFWPFTTQTGVERLVPNPTFLPQGGRFSALASGEVRFRNRGGQGFALFGDAGVLGSKLIELWRLDRTLRWDVGLGYRQSTPVGPVRIDLAVRPSYPEDLAPLRPEEVSGEPGIEDPAWFRGRTYGCDAFPDARLTRRVPGGVPGFPVSNAWKGSMPPVILNLSIAIGEAI